MSDSKKNFWKLEKFSLQYFHYIYIDTIENLADQLFISRKVRVYFGQEGKKEGSPYKVIFCKIKKKDEPEFLEALSELENKMLLMGHRDYQEFCIAMNNLIPD